MSLAHSLVSADGSAPTQWMVCLHGILGAGANWRTFARQLVAERPSWGVCLVDLRMHGQSQHLAPPHTVPAAAEDVRALAATLPGPARAVLGHSFGGKVALELFREEKSLERLVSLDSDPGARPDAHGSEDTVRVITVLSAMEGQRFPTREAFHRALLSLGFRDAIVQWLAMNLQRDGEEYRFRLEMRAIRELLQSYLHTDHWPLLEAVARGERPAARLVLVVGGRSTVYLPAERARLVELAERSGGRLRAVLLPEAGHWVHVDDPAGTRDAVLLALDD